MKPLKLTIGSVAVVLFAGLAAAQGIGNGAGDGGGPNSGPVAGKVAPQGAGGASWGSAQLFAVVNSNGTRARGKGDIFSNRSSVGNYQVRFARNVRLCGYTASIGLTGASGVSAPGFITVVGEAASVLGVWVQTRNVSGAPADMAFHLYVDC